MLKEKQLPKFLSGFENFHAFWEPKWELYSVKVKPGEFYIANDDLVISTLLGSCVSACIYDPVKCCGGLNHFMLPAGEYDQDIQRSARYGLFAMEQLINELMKHGCQRDDLEVKLTGGGHMIMGLTNIGQQNINFILQYIQDEGLKLTAQDLGGDQARRVAFFPKTGRLLVKKLDHRDDQRLIAQERSYRIDVEQHLDDSDVELF